MEPKFKENDRVWIFWSDYIDYEFEEMTVSRVDISPIGDVAYKLDAVQTSSVIGACRDEDAIFNTKEEAKEAAIKEATKIHERIIKNIERA